MAKTIKQIADEIGVSKQTVYKRYKGKLYTVCAPYAHTEQGVLYIEEQGETLIKQDFLQKECSIGAHTERSNGAVLEQSENAGVVAVLQTTIDTLQGQLAIKDKQIEELKPDFVSTDCETCKWQIEMSTSRKVKNPISTIAEALDVEETRRLNKA